MNTGGRHMSSPGTHLSGRVYTMKTILIGTLVLLSGIVGIVLLVGRTHDAVPNAQAPVQQPQEQAWKTVDFGMINSAFLFSGELPDSFEITYVPSTNAVVVSDPSLEGEQSVVYITKFTSDRFLTLNTVDIYQQSPMRIKGRDAVFYDIQKKDGVPDFPGQPSWRNARHFALDIRVSEDSPSVFYPIAYARDFPEDMFWRFVNSLEFSS